MNLQFRSPAIQGFTLTEMMVTLAIIGVMAVIAGPSFREVIAMSQVKTAASDLHMTLTRARSEAIKRNSGVAVDAAGGDWANGWSISSDGVVIDSHGSVKASIAGPAAFTYNANGRGGAANFDVSSPDTATKRCVAVGLNGQPSVLQKACQ